MAQTIAKRLSEKIQDNRKLKDEAIALKSTIKDNEEKIKGLQTHLSEEEAKVKKWEKMQEQGYTAVTINDGMITNATTVLPYSTFTYTQKIPKEIGSGLYAKFPFYRLADGKMVIDTQKFMRYKSI